MPDDARLLIHLVAKPGHVQVACPTWRERLRVEARRDLVEAEAELSHRLIVSKPLHAHADPYSITLLRDLDGLKQAILVIVVERATDRPVRLGKLSDPCIPLEARTRLPALPESDHACESRPSRYCQDQGDEATHGDTVPSTTRSSRFRARSSGDAATPLAVRALGYSADVRRRAKRSRGHGRCSADAFSIEQRRPCSRIRISVWIAERCGRRASATRVRRGVRRPTESSRRRSRQVPAHLFGHACMDAVVGDALMRACFEHARAWQLAIRALARR